MKPEILKMDPENFRKFFGKDNDGFVTTQDFLKTLTKIWTDTRAFIKTLPKKGKTNGEKTRIRESEPMLKYHDFCNYIAPFLGTYSGRGTIDNIHDCFDQYLAGRSKDDVMMALADIDAVYEGDTDHVPVYFTGDVKSSDAGTNALYEVLPDDFLNLDELAEQPIEAGKQLRGNGILESLYRVNGHKGYLLNVCKPRDQVVVAQEVVKNSLENLKKYAKQGPERIQLIAQIEAAKRDLHQYVRSRNWPPENWRREIEAAERLQDIEIDGIMACRVKDATVGRSSQTGVLMPEVRGITLAALREGEECGFSKYALAPGTCGQFENIYFQANEQGVVPSDLRMHNVMLTPLGMDGEVFILGNPIVINTDWLTTPTLIKDVAASDMSGVRRDVIDYLRMKDPAEK